MALRKYKRAGRTNTRATRPLSTAANAKPREQGADAVEPASLPQAVNAVPLESATPPPSPTPSQPTPSPHSSSDTLSLKDQLDLLRRAGQQRQAESHEATAAPAPPQSFASTPLEAQLDAIPNLSVAQRAYLRERPYALARPDILSWGHNFAQYYGVPVDSPAYFQVLDEALHQYGNIAFTTPATASPATETQASAPTPQPTPAPMPQAPQPPAPDRDDDSAPHFVSAPPSRSEYAGSVPPPDVAAGRVTLTPEERSVAAATGISEVVYAKNKLKLQQMKKAGLIKD
jgi:hypothetical protein